MSKILNPDLKLRAIQNTLEIEAQGLNLLAKAVDQTAVSAVDLIAKCQGRVICAGVGKSGHIARKIAATFASTGTPAQFVHPSEASHGDLGMITDKDVVIALSKSGETHELSDLITYCRRFGVVLIAITANAQSSLAIRSDLCLLLPDTPEACGETSAPTTSTTLMMAYGDALAVALVEQRGFTAQDFKKFHPGGSLGSALASVSDIMRKADNLPLVEHHALMADALIEMSAKGVGCVGIIDMDDSSLIGIITDGDLRRHMSDNLASYPVEAIMTPAPATISPDRLASEAMAQMTSGRVKITQLFVCDSHNRPIGVLHIHDLLRAGIA